MGPMLTQCWQSSSMEKREAETWCLQCPDVTAHTFMGCQIHSQGHTLPISDSLSVHLHPPSPHCTAQHNNACPVQYSRAKDLKRPVCAQLDPGSQGSPTALSVHMLIYEADSQSL